MDIEIIVFDGFDELDAIAPFEVLRHAANAGSALHGRLVGADGPGDVRAANGLLRGSTRASARPDAVVVPGGGWWMAARAPAPKPNGVAGPAGRAGPLAALDGVGVHGGDAAGRGRPATGRTATTNRGAHDQLRAAGTTVRDERVVDDGNVVTAGGPSCGIDLGLWLTEKEAGAEVADRTASVIQYDWTHSVWDRR